MAFAATVLANTVHGNQRVIQYLITADAVSGNVQTGLGVITALSSSPQSLSTMTSFKVRANALGGATAAAGYLGFDGYTSGDEIYVTAYGR